MSSDHSQNHYEPNASFDGYDSDLASAGILIESLRQQLAACERQRDKLKFALENCSFDDNMTKLLGKMTKINDRNARFRTVISLVIDHRELQFEGIVRGEILRERRGSRLITGRCSPPWPRWPTRPLFTVWSWAVCFFAVLHSISRHRLGFARRRRSDTTGIH